MYYKVVKGLPSHLTPASSEWSQLFSLTGLVLHWSSDGSVPLHTTLSNRIGPEPLPKKAPRSGNGSTNKRECFTMKLYQYVTWWEKTRHFSHCDKIEITLGIILLVSYELATYHFLFILETKFPSFGHSYFWTWNDPSDSTLCVPELCKFCVSMQRLPQSTYILWKWSSNSIKSFHQQQRKPLQL